MGEPNFTSRAPVPPPLVLNWAAESLKAAVKTTSHAMHWDKASAHDVPVLTASGDRYTLHPETEAFSRWQQQAKQWEPRSAFVLELLRKLENILSDRNFFESNCTLSTQKSEGATGLTPRMTPRAKEPLLDQAGFLRLLHTAGIVGQVGGMVDDQYALDVYLKTYMRTGSRGLGTQPCIPFEVYQYCLWQIGAHSAKMDMKHLIAEPGLIDSNCLPTLIALEIGESRGKPTVDALEATRLELEQEISGGSGGWVSPHKMSITRARTATVPNSKVAVPGPGMYVKHLFSPFPNESIFPGAPKSSGGVRGWTWGSAEQRQFMKVTLQEIGLGPGPAAYGDNDLGMRRQQIGYGTGQLPGSARHAQFGTAERELSVAHATIAGMKGGLTCELLNGVPQARKPMLRKGDRKYVKDVVPTPQQLKEARNFLEYMFKQENLRKQAPPDMCRLATGETFIQTGRGQFEKYDHSAVGKMEIELPPPVKESCFLLKDLQRDSELFAKYCTTNRNAYGTTVYIEIHTFLQVLHDLEILGIFQHQITRDVAERIFKRIGGRWAKEIPEDQFNMCLRSVQEYLIFQALSTMDVQLEPSTPRPPASAVSFREEQFAQSARTGTNDSEVGLWDGVGWKSPKRLQNTATSRCLTHRSTSIHCHLGPGAYGVPNRDKTIQRTRTFWKQRKGWDMVTQERPVPDLSVRWGAMNGMNSYKTFLGSPRHAHCGVEIPWSSKLPKNPSATFGNTPRFPNPPPYPP